MRNDENLSGLNRCLFFFYFHARSKTPQSLWISSYNAISDSLTPILYNTHAGKICKVVRTTIQWSSLVRITPSKQIWKIFKVVFFRRRVGAQNDVIKTRLMNEKEKNKPGWICTTSFYTSLTVDWWQKHLKGDKTCMKPSIRKFVRLIRRETVCCRRFRMTIGRSNTFNPWLWDSLYIAIKKR